MVKICTVVLEMMLMHNDERQHRAIVHLSDSGDLKCQHISMNASFFDKLDFSSPYMVKNPCTCLVTDKRYSDEIAHKVSIINRSTKSNIILNRDQQGNSFNI